VGCLAENLNSGELRRLLIVSPSGGLNDLLCQLTDALTLAEYVNSAVVIDNPHKSGATRFLGDLFTFKTNQEVFLDLDQQDQSALDDFLKGEGLAVFRTETRTQNALKKSLRFTNSRGEVIFFTGRKGGKHGALFFDYVDLAQDLLARSIEEAKLVDVETIGLHIRHSDYKTEFTSVIDNVRQKFPNTKIFVSSDSAKVVEYARQKLNSNLISPPRLRPPGDHPLHKQPGSVGVNLHRQLAFETILDLMLLGRCGRFLYTPSINEGPGRPVLISGFSRLVVGYRKKSHTLAEFSKTTMNPRMIVTRKQALRFTAHFAGRFLEKAHTQIAAKLTR